MGSIVKKTPDAKTGVRLQVLDISIEIAILEVVSKCWKLYLLLLDQFP